MNTRRKLPYVCEWYCNHFLVGFDPFLNLNKILWFIQYMIKVKNLINEKERKNNTSYVHVNCHIVRANIVMTWWSVEDLQERRDSFLLNFELFFCFNFTFLCYANHQGTNNWFLENWTMKFCTYPSMEPHNIVQKRMDVTKYNTDLPSQWVCWKWHLSNYFKCLCI
jgi:hypothetical protein